MRIAFSSIIVVMLWVPLALGQDSAQPAIAAKPGKMITFEVLIADLLEPLESPTVPKILELEKAGKLKFLSRLQLTSLEEQTASVQFGEATSRATGRARAGRGFGGGPFGPQAVPVYSNVNVGTVVQLTARMEEDGSIVTRLMAERSGLKEGPDQPVDPNDATPPESVERLRTETTLRLKPGEAQLVGGRQATTGKDTNRTWIVLTARIGDKPSPAAK